MSKIPVFTTVSRTYGFLLGEFGTIFRLAWAPLLIAAGLNYVYGGQAMDAIVQAKDNPAAVMQSMQVNFLVGIAGFIANVIVLVALLRVVIFGDRKTGMAIYIWFGGTELRLILVYVLLIVAVIAAMIGLGIAFGLIAAVAAAVPGVAILLPFVMLAIVVGIIWAALKLMLIPAVVVAENSLGVERAWALMRGNALRMFLVLLMTYVPIGLLGAIVSFAILGSDFPPLPDFTALSSGKQTPEEVRQIAEQWQTGILGAIRLHWLEFSVLNFFGGIIGAALVSGVTGNAYTALAGERH